jgi:ubiquinone/menaquinone biosynthesis C-methylase UbiE
MLDAAGVGSGQRVLDLAAGTGDQTLLVGRRVGPTGSVLATDISPNMLEAAAAAAKKAGLDNISTLVADASAIELDSNSFDAAICRFGLMFVPNLPEALVRVQGGLKPGARLAALVWSTADLNPYIGLQLALVNEMGRMPSPLPSLARTVSLSAPGVLETAFTDAGYSGVQVAPVATPRDFPSLEEALEAMRSTSPAQGELGRMMSDAERAYYTAELERRVAAYVLPDGRCVLPGEALLAVGTK